MKPIFFLVLLCVTASSFAAPTVYNIRDYGATGQKADNATEGIAKAIAAAKAAGGGVVQVPPGDYTCLGRAC